jgi:phospholipid/cholesterol/gamma-HCH transport system ATP-binding protein
VAGRELVGADEETRAGVLRDLGVAFQSGALFDSLTLVENVLVPIQANSRLPAATAELLARVTLATVGLADAADLHPAEISGGMRKRAGIARAIALDPKILVLDEPTSGLDPLTAAGLDHLIATLNHSLGITVLMVTHDLATTFAVAHRCMLIDGDERGILAAGVPEELRRSHPNPKVRAFFERTV